MIRSASVLLILFLSPALAFAQGRLWIDFTPRLIELVPGVYAYEGSQDGYCCDVNQKEPLGPNQQDQSTVRTNSLVVVTDDGVVVADGMDSPQLGRRMLADIRKVTDKPVKYLINASPHADHTNSNEVFEDATIVAHWNGRKAMEEFNKRPWGHTGGRNQPGAKYNITIPQVVFGTEQWDAPATRDEKMTLMVGGKQIDLYYFGWGHTRGDIIVHLPAEKVLFMSENFFSRIFISVGEGRAEQWLDTVGKAMKLDYEWVIPGHGEIYGMSAAELRAEFEKCFEMVKLIVDNVKEHVDRGDSLEKTMADADTFMGEFAKRSFYESSRPDLAGLKERSIRSTYESFMKKKGMTSQ